MHFIIKKDGEYMEVTKLPDAYDMNKYVKEKANNEASTCPFCGEYKKYPIFIEPGNRDNTCVEHCWLYMEWYGDKNRNETLLSSLNPFKKKRHHWRQDEYHCHTCGASWITEPYRTDY